MVYEGRSPASSRGTSDEPAEVRLDSWKEIATDVKRDISTVQRWEQREGMPIHRHVHDKRGSVYALRSELDAWLLGRRVEAPVDAEGVREPSGTPWAGRRLLVSWFALSGWLATRSQPRHTGLQDGLQILRGSCYTL